MPDYRKVQLPQDDDASPIQVLGHDSASVASAQMAGTSARFALPSGADVVEVAALADCHIAFGDSSVTAATTGSVFPKGAAVYKVLSGQTHLAFILASGASAARITATKLK